MNRKSQDFYICVITDIEDNRDITGFLPQDEKFLIDLIQLNDFTLEHLKHNDLFLIALRNPESIPSELIQMLINNHKEKNTVIGSKKIKPREAIRFIRAGFAEVFDLENDTALLHEWMLEKYEEKLRSATRHAPLQDESPIRKIIGISHPIEKVRQLCLQASRMPEMTVLIQGATGTGKELVAKVIHELSIRSANPFVEVNCSAIPESLMESEMYGYEKGAFTDAQRQKQGLFEMARGGTLFLDEIGVMSLNLQNKLLKAVEEKKIRRIGGDKVLDIDTRIIAGTNVDLKEASVSGTFRADLYYRLNVFTIQVPSLAARKDDIPVLAEFFLKEINRRYSLNVSSMHPAVLDLLLHHSWPGNIRELKHAIERSAVLAQKGRILPTHLPEEIQKIDLDTHSSPVELQLDSDRITLPLPSEGYALDDMEKLIIKEILTRFKGNQTRAAQYLKISRTRLIRNLPGRPKLIS